MPWHKKPLRPLRRCCICRPARANQRAEPHPPADEHEQRPRQTERVGQREDPPGSAGLEEADALASRIVVIQKGQVIAEGTPQELKTADGSRAIRCTTSLTASFVSAIAGVTSVEQDGNAMLVRTPAPEAV
ncbi:hypothetical protein B4Q13_24730, partial [Lacticaseibacillus rhamnosus]